MINSLRKYRLKWLKKMTFLPPEKYVQYLYEYYTGKKLNLDKPIEFNAKIQWYKVFYRPQILNQLVDKYAVRSYVKAKIGEQYLNEMFAVYNKLSEIDFNKLPNQFVVKATHASSYNLIVKDKEQLNKSKTFVLFNKWLKRNQYYRTGQEWAYKDVQPRLITEKYLKEAGQGSLIDYKFYCFNGLVKFVEVHLERTKDYKRGFFDLDFKILPFNKGETQHAITAAVKKPDNFDEMIFLANKLAEKLPFVRVDFYSVNGKAIFGEMTFYPADGRKDFYPEEYNKIIGDYFKLPEIPKGKKYITVI